MPQLGTFGRIGVGKDVACWPRSRKMGTPAFVARSLGKGKVFYVAAQPGLASLWSAPCSRPWSRTAAQPRIRCRLPSIQARRPRAANRPRCRPHQAVLTAEPGPIDARVLQAPGGYVVPLANYQATVGQKVKLTLRLPTAVSKAENHPITDAAVEKEDGAITVTIPALGYGDAPRLTEK